MSQKAANKLIIATSWAALAVCVVAWPLTALTVAKDEPQFVLGLSWAAIIYSAIQVLIQGYTKKSADIAASPSEEPTNPT